MFSTKNGASRLLIAVVVGLIVVKGVVAWLTGSISILAQAADSLLDLMAGIVTFLAIRMASKPADKEHPYGHGKWEDIAGTVQGVIIMTAAGLVVYASIRRLLEGTTVTLTESGIIVMAISIVVSILLSRHLLRVARAEGSVALEANARNIRADVYSAAAVLGGLVAVRFTGIGDIDSIVALGVAGYIFRMGYQVLSNPLSALLDTRLSAQQESVIRDCLGAYTGRIAGYHALRTRRSGSDRYIDLHLVFEKAISLDEAHRICDQVESDIEKRLPRSNVIIHPEPCDENCEQCGAVCAERRSDDLK